MWKSKIKHVSFDFWNTLFKSNLDFSHLRANFIYNNYNPFGVTLDRINEIIEFNGKCVDDINALLGYNIPSKEIYARVLIDLGCNLDSINIFELEYKINELFICAPPIIYDNDTIKVLCDLKNKKVSMNISSNTAYISGRVLNKVLKKNNILEYFSFKIYSDQINKSKPNPLFFSKVFNEAKKINSLIKTRKAILHVGDNLIADIEGSKLAGFNSFQINTNNCTIKDILNAGNIFTV